MPFPWTLQRYILRELTKTFLLAAVGLMALLGLGGGVMNMIKLGGVTPGQLLRLMALVLPLSAALTLPIAALFSATATYGRISSDNEFVACRASGINLHILFLPTIALSLFAAGASFGLTNFVIPRMVQNLNEFVGSDFSAMIEQQVSRPRGLTLGGKNAYRVYADRCLSVPDEPNRVTLERVAWVEVEQRDWIRYGTFRRLHLLFHPTETPPRISAVAEGVSWYDSKVGQFFENERQSIASSRMSSFVPSKIKFLNLNELFHYLDHPTEWHEVRERMASLRIDSGRLEALREVWDDLAADKTATISDADSSMTIRSEEAPQAIKGDSFELGRVTIDERGTEGRRSITAERARIAITSGDDLAQCGIRIEIFNARVGGDPRAFVRGKIVLGPVAIDSAMIARLTARTDAELLIGHAGVVSQSLEKQRENILAETGETLRRVIGAINERLASSISVFVLVILAAALGIVFRGSQVTAAFGISFVPALFVIVAIVMGRQMAQNESTHALGLVVIWGGIVLVTLLDGWVLLRVLRR